MAIYHHVKYTIKNHIIMISERYIIPYIMNILSLKKYITLISYHNGVILFGVISQHTYIYIYVYIYMYYVYTYLIYPKQFLRKLLGSLGLQSILYITIRMYIYNMIYPHLYMVYIDTRYRYIYIYVLVYIYIYYTYHNLCIPFCLEFCCARQTTSHHHRFRQAPRACVQRLRRRRMRRTGGRRERC